MGSGPATSTGGPLSAESGPGTAHPGEVELVHYIRGTLDRGHAAALLAHCLLCAMCGRRLDLRLRDERPPAPSGTLSVPPE
jgi:hypothetical protein